MYKIVLADDEEIVRSGLKYFLDWESLGFHIVADFEDGKETIDYLNQHHADIVLTDIRMAEVSGLMLAKHIHEQHPHIRVVIISGFKDFEYAQQAIQYNVQHYLLKPTKYDEMVTVFQDLKQKLDSQRSQETTLKQQSTRYNELLPLLQEQFYTDLAMGALRNAEELRKRIQLLALPMNPDNCPSALLELKLADQNIDDKRREKLTHSLKNIFQAENRLFHYKAIFNNHGMKLVAFPVASIGMELLRERLVADLDEMTTRIRHSFDLSLHYEITSTFHNLIELACYSTPLTLVYNEARGKNRLEAAEYGHLVEKYKVFISHVNDGEIEETISLIDRFLDEFRNLPISFAHRLIMDLFAMVFRSFSDRGLLGKTLHESYYNYHVVIEFTELEDIRHWAKKFIRELMLISMPSKETNATLIVEAARTYIANNYARELSLEEVADHVFLNHIYFSRIFKQTTGINYIDYLTQLRLQKSIELLESRQFKIHEISEKVGYRSSKYFTRLFKQTTGVSPKDYIRKHSLLAKDAEDEIKP